LLVPDCFYHSGDDDSGLRGPVGMHPVSLTHHGIFFFPESDWRT
jgi:hypothetical protein